MPNRRLIRLTKKWFFYISKDRRSFDMGLPEIQTSPTLSAVSSKHTLLSPVHQQAATGSRSPGLLSYRCQGANGTSELGPALPAPGRMDPPTSKSRLALCITRLWRSSGDRCCGGRPHDTSEELIPGAAHAAQDSNQASHARACGRVYLGRPLLSLLGPGLVHLQSRHGERTRQFSANLASSTIRGRVNPPEGPVL